MTAHAEQRPLTNHELENKLAMIEKGQQLAGHFPSTDDLEAARRILTGETTYEDEMADFDQKFGE